MQVFLVINLKRKGNLELGSQIRQYLEQLGHSVCIEQAIHLHDHSYAIAPGQYDLAIILGGDGTALYATRYCAPAGLPMIFLPLGRLCFLSNLALEDWQSILDDYYQGLYHIDEKMMLKIEIFHKDQLIMEKICLNDIYFKCYKSYRIIEYVMDIGKTRLGPYRADGLIVSSSTGAMGYTFSQGGPVLSPELFCTLLTPMAPHTLSNRTLILPKEKKVKIQASEQYTENALLIIDGQEFIPIDRQDYFQVSQYEKNALFIDRRPEAFFQKVKDKFHY